MLSRVLAASVMVALSSPAFASVASELASIEKRLDTCIDKDESTLGMKACTSDALKAADAVLNRVYKAGVDTLKHTSAEGSAEDDKEKLKRLVASERAWVAYKDADCELQGTQMLGGTGESLTIGQCLYTMTKERAKSLDTFFAEK